MGKLFDFNRDGERSFGEEMLGLGLIGAVFQAAEQKKLARQAAFEAEEEAERIANLERNLESLREQLSKLEEEGWGKCPVCIAKTQYSFSDDPKALGAPKDFTLHIRSVRLSAGAGFVVAFAGDIIAMPGLPRVPAAEGIDVNAEGKIVGLF